MAHLVLARKYRPQRFADVAGQDHVTHTLLNSLAQGRLAHGYIFSGHRGIGKTTIARILAMALNCRSEIGSPERPTAEPCGECVACTEIRAGNAVDVIEIDAATNRGIDEIRELRDAARYRPSRDRYKIYILDEAHQITDAAWNALLKTLEEPPDHMVFMMATTQPEDIPQTIRSRCQHYSFHAVKYEAILAQLRWIATEEKVDAGEDALALLAEAGDGSMRDALSIMDQAIASAPTTAGRAVLDAVQIRGLMGTVSNAVFEQMLEAVSANQSAAMLELADQLLNAGNSPAQLARQMVRYLRNCLMAKISGATPDNPASALLQTSSDERQRSARTAMLFTEEELARFLQVMLRTFDDLGYRQEQRLHFELGLLKLVHLQRLLPLEELLSKLPAGSPVRTQAAAAYTPPRSSATPSASSPSAPQARSIPEARMSADTAPRAGNLLVTEMTHGSLALAGAARTQPETAPEALPHITPPAQNVAPATASSLQAALCDALAEMGDNTLADQMQAAQWTLTETEIRVQTRIPESILSTMFHKKAAQLAQNLFRNAGAAHLKLNLLPAVAGAVVESTSAAPIRAAKPGTAQARALDHPLVRHAQELFSAEIRHITDLSQKP
jgi:DNA polymerase-3 subunit gamma/tau